MIEDDRIEGPAPKNFEEFIVYASIGQAEYLLKYCSLLYPESLITPGTDYINNGDLAADLFLEGGVWEHMTFSRIVDDLSAFCHDVGEQTILNFMADQKITAYDFGAIFADTRTGGINSFALLEPPFEMNEYDRNEYTKRINILNKNALAQGKVTLLCQIDGTDQIISIEVVEENYVEPAFPSETSI